MYFLRKITFYVPSKEKTSYFQKRKRNTIFPDITKRIIFQCDFFWKDHLFRTFEENIVFPFFFFFLERLSFLFRLKIIFSEKRNMIFPDNTRKIIFQCDIFGKTIFSEKLEIEKMVFRAVYFVLFYSLI